MFHEDSLSDLSGADSVDDLQAEVRWLDHRVNELPVDVARKEELHEWSLFQLKNICHNDDEVGFYTGFPDYDSLMAFFQELFQCDTEVMQQWREANSKPEYEEPKCGRKCKLPLLEQFFLTLVRLRLGLLEHDIAHQFEVSQSTVCRLTLTWVNVMFLCLKAVECFPPWHVVKKFIPASFLKYYPQTWLIIDATEVAVERPASLAVQASTFSSYNNCNTVKVLVAITPSGAMCFVSPLFEGSVSD